MIQRRPSFWEKDTLLGPADLVVVGSGLVGLSAALEWKRQRPSDKVVVLERGFLPAGASTRNAGFACFGSPSELLDDLKDRNAEAVWELVERRWKGLLFLRQLLGDTHLDYFTTGSYEVFHETDDADYGTCMDALVDLNRELRAITGQEDVFVNRDAVIGSLGFRHVKHLLFNKLEGQLHPGKMIDRLVHLAQESGVRIITGASVQGLEIHGDRYHLQLTETFTYQAEHILVATNGFARQLLPELELKPARNQVLITAPIPDLQVKGCFHYDRGYVYFRNVGNRLLLGGGRNRHAEQEQTDQFGLTANIQDYLVELLNTHYLPGIPFSIEESWSGILGLGTHKSPIFRFLKERVFVAVRLGGMGVALGAGLGTDAAREMLNNA